MLVEKKLVGNFLKKGETIKDGDIIEFLDEGRQDNTGNFGPKIVFQVKGSNGEGGLNVNQTSMNNLIDCYGGETRGWIGQKAKVWLNRENVSGKFVQVLYLTHPDQELGKLYQAVNEEIMSEIE